MEAGAERLVAHSSELSDVVDSARSHGVVALDTEFLREKTYLARLCLIQIATSEALWLVDPLTATDLAPVAALIADPAVELVVHAGKQDLEIFYESCGAVPHNVFDVQVAAGFAGLGASLPYGRLVESALGVTLAKGEAYSDWCRRPLTPTQLRYAADDVRYLLEARAHLRARLEDLGRLDWAIEEMRSLASEDSYGSDLDEVWRRVSGRGSVGSRHLPVLRELARWREETARARDIPRGWVVKDPTLVEIARRAPDSESRLSAIRGVNKEVTRAAPAVLAAIRKGLASPPMSEPSPPSRSAQARARMLAGLADALVRARCERAQIAPEQVSTRADLESLLALVVSGAVRSSSIGDSPHRLLQGWRADLAGRAVAELAEGRIALKAVAQPPYIEEVRVE